MNVWLLELLGPQGGVPLWNVFARRGSTVLTKYNT